MPLPCSLSWRAHRTTWRPSSRRAAADERSDVYAAGVLLYELLAGRVPYPYESVGAVNARRQLTEVPAPISSVRDGVPVSLDAVLTRRPRGGARAAVRIGERVGRRLAPGAVRRRRATRRGCAPGRGSGPHRHRRDDHPSRGGAASAGAASAAAGSGRRRGWRAPPDLRARLRCLPRRLPNPPSGRSGGGSKRRRNSIIAAVMVVVLIAAVVGVAGALVGRRSHRRRDLPRPARRHARRGQRSVRPAEHRSGRRRAEGARDQSERGAATGAGRWRDPRRRAVPSPASTAVPATRRCATPRS